jgi:hypothetical protein
LAVSMASVMEGGAFSAQGAAASVVLILDLAEGVKSGDRPTRRAALSRHAA